jgi:AraC-like DNA-binding protein
MANPVGRPPVELDMEQLAALMRFRPTREDAAAFFGVSADTVERRIKADTGLTFLQFREQKMVHTRISLVRNALKRAETSDAMLIFCLKNLCGWSDNATQSAVVEIPRAMISVIGKTVTTDAEPIPISGKQA